MVFKLLVLYRFEPKEPVATEPFKILFKITNNGDEKFQGGKISEMKIQYEQFYQQISVDLQTIPELDVGKSFEFDFDSVPIIDGLAWISLTLKSGEANIPLFQTNEYSQPTFSVPFYIRNKDLVKILDVLVEINKKITEKEGNK